MFILGPVSKGTWFYLTQANDAYHLFLPCSFMSQVALEPKHRQSCIFISFIY